jgi:aldose sugar dehydrogenase
VPPYPTGPIIKDPHLKVELVSAGLQYPTSTAFLSSNDILVTEKDTGTVKRVVNGTVLVATFGHRRLLGIATTMFSSTTPNLPRKTVKMPLYQKTNRQSMISI